MKPATIVVDRNEKAWSLREVNLVRPPTHQWHRWQIITVVRGDRLAEWWQDLGPASRYPRPQVEIPSLGEHSVAELQDMAEHYRCEDNYWLQYSQAVAADSTLIRDWVDQVEERSEVINNRSRFGPGYTKQRDGFDRKAAVNGG